MIRTYTIIGLFLFVMSNHLFAQKFPNHYQNKWDTCHSCTDCHNEENYKTLIRLASGIFIEFKESDKLCGQCHGGLHRDWKVGVHGKRTGYWNGEKKYLQCVNCHDPHITKFKAIAPDPPPIIQGELTTLSHYSIKKEDDE